MRKISRLGVCAGVLTVVGLAITGCGGSQETSPSTDVELTGDPVTLDEELTALCVEVVEQGLPADAATALAEASGYTFVIVQDGGQAPTQPTNVVLTVRDDVVVACSPG